MSEWKLLKKLQNSQTNVRYNDFIILIEAFGFKHMRTSGSNSIYKHKDTPSLVNVQNNKGKAISN